MTRAESQTVLHGVESVDNVDLHDLKFEEIK